MNLVVGIQPWGTGEVSIVDMDTGEQVKHLRIEGDVTDIAQAAKAYMGALDIRPPMILCNEPMTDEAKEQCMKAIKDAQQEPGVILPQGAHLPMPQYAGITILCPCLMGDRIHKVDKADWSRFAYYLAGCLNGDVPIHLTTPSEAAKIAKAHGVQSATPAQHAAIFSSHQAFFQKPLQIDQDSVSGQTEDSGPLAAAKASGCPLDPLPESD